MPGGRWLSLLGSPGVRSGLRQAEVLEHAVDVVARDVFNAFRVVVERGDDGEDGGAGLGDSGHVAQVNEVERGFADAEYEAAAFLQADVGGALDKVLGQAVGDAAQGSHGAGKDDHGGDGVGTRSDRRADVLMRQQRDAICGVAEELFHKAGATGYANLFGEDTKSAGRDDEVNAVDAVVVFEGAKHLDGEYRTAGACHREDDIGRRGDCGSSGSCGAGVGYGGHQHRLCSRICIFQKTFANVLC